MKDIRNEAIIGLGEKTGHKHVVRGTVQVLEEKDGVVTQFRTDDPVKVNHPEHDVQEVVKKKDKWSVRSVQEYDHYAEEVRNVKD